jgi:hypothetical protein
MAEVKLLKHKVVSLKAHPDLDEAWVHQQIKDDPSILGLGDNLRVQESERRQAKAGRLDILLVDDEAEPGRRYEVEVQLGATDASHIVRCVEYWDNERRRYPRYEHRPVLVAEDITSRFFNVIQLFGKAIPIVAIKMVASKVGDGLVLQFVKVLDETPHSPEEEEESRVSPAADRAYWERRGSRESMQVLDALFKLFAMSNATVQAHFTQSYIVPYVGSKSGWSLLMRPRKKFVIVSVAFDEPEEANGWKAKLGAAGLDSEGSYPEEVTFRLTPETLERNREVVTEMLKAAYAGD